MPPVLLDSLRLYYNRIPKAAGTTMVTILHRLAARNNFSHHSSGVYNRRHLTDSEQLELVSDVMNAVPPVTFDRHVHFVNFNMYAAIVRFNVLEYSTVELNARKQQ